ncbi:MAG: DUF5615 family PIN-like protein [Actinomycetota bacterium]|nr:DUF5615 family PIN-like protein [Actinomycetota bacterium]
MLALLLDAMYPASIARALREHGHDVIACQEDSELRLLDDRTLLTRARSEGRVLVTENAKDFLPLVALGPSEGQGELALILTSNATFPRHTDRFIGDLIKALDVFLRQPPGSASEIPVHWLRRGSP